MISITYARKISAASVSTPAALPYCSANYANHCEHTNPYQMSC